MRNEELKPCPFCGAHGGLEECPPQGDWNHLFWVECKGDYCGISGKIRYSPEDAIDAWNRRYTPCRAHQQGPGQWICDCTTMRPDCKPNAGVPGTGGNHA